MVSVMVATPEDEILLCFRFSTTPFDEVIVANVSAPLTILEPPLVLEMVTAEIAALVAVFPLRTCEEVVRFSVAPAAVPSIVSVSAIATSDP